MHVTNLLFQPGVVLPSGFYGQRVLFTFVQIAIPSVYRRDFRADIHAGGQFFADQVLCQVFRGGMIGHGGEHQQEVVGMLRLSIDESSPACFVRAMPQL